MDLCFYKKEMFLCTIFLHSNNQMQKELFNNMFEIEENYPALLF